MYLQSAWAQPDNNRPSSAAPTPCQAIVRYLPRIAAVASLPVGVSQLPPAGGVRGLLLDADLVFCNAVAWRRGLVALLARVGYDAKTELGSSAWRSLQLADVYRGRRELGDGLDDYLRALPIRRGQRDEVLSAALAQWRTGQNPLHLFPGVRQTLHQMSAMGAHLAVVANCTSTSDALQEQLSEVGLEDAVQVVTTSVDSDCLLPDPRIYQLARERLRLSAAETLVVSSRDNASAEAVAAMAPRYVVCDREPDSADGYRVNCLGELAALFSPASTLAKAG